MSTQKETVDSTKLNVGDIPTSTFSFLKYAHPSPSQLLHGALAPEFSSFSFLPDYTEHPKHKNLKRRKSLEQPPPAPPAPPEDEALDEVTFFQDFVAGGMAGCASVVVGHPFDTIKVRVQSSTSSGGILGTLAEFGGVSSLFRGMAAPLSAATVINAVVFSSYGAASKSYDQYFPTVDDEDDDGPDINHDPWQKSMSCGSFAGLVQCFIICPMEHVKCRLQVGTGGYKGPTQAVKSIVKEFGVMGLYQGWWSTFWREVPAFGMYFATYDVIKDKVNTFFSKRAAKAGTLTDISNDPMGMGHSHTWLASALAGGSAGCLTWGIVYPVDMIKTRIQTSPLSTPKSELKMWAIGSAMVKKHGWRYLYRGFGITMIRAFPVNGTIFPVYEFTLLQMRRWQADQ